MSRKIADEIFQEISRQNALLGMRAVVHSDEFVKYISASMAVNPELCRRVLAVLVRSHKIFLMEIVAEDKAREIPRVEGYIVADLPVIRKLKNYYQSELMIEYEKKFQKKHLVHQIVKELLPIMKSLNNTPLGQLANKAIMLEEFERLLEKNPLEYGVEWKEQHMEIELKKANFETPPERRDGAAGKTQAGRKAEAAVGQAGRAVDSERYTEFISKSKSYPLQKILKIYGINFFLQVHLRKCQFPALQKLVEDGQITRRSDLTLLREMLQKVKQNINVDKNLTGRTEELYALEQTVVHRLYFAGKDS